MKGIKGRKCSQFADLWQYNLYIKESLWLINKNKPKLTQKLNGIKIDKQFLWLTGRA